MVESYSDNSIESFDGNYGEIQKYIEGLSTEIARSSTAVVQAKLCKDKTSINKVLERIVLLRLKHKTNCRLDLFQGGYQEQQDALTSCFVID